MRSLLGSWLTSSIARLIELGPRRRCVESGQVLLDQAKHLLDQLLICCAAACGSARRICLSRRAKSGGAIRIWAICQSMPLEAGVRDIEPVQAHQHAQNPMLDLDQRAIQHQQVVARGEHLGVEARLEVQVALDRGMHQRVGYAAALARQRSTSSAPCSGRPC